ncbi:hypothetical protein HDU97_002738 [Phlyctochytrium planicorne]|nr:hypothetical protein HDU97_002738 [Phlyctochytrium planicorne]
MGIITPPITTVGRSGVATDDVYIDRKMHHTRWMGPNVESWMRCSAEFNTFSQILHITTQYETDDTESGPRGKFYIYGYDRIGKLIFHFETNDIGIGGKIDGTVRIETYAISKPLTHIENIASTSCLRVDSIPNGHTRQDIVEKALTYRCCAIDVIFTSRLTVS